jgi:hypothetical protein
MFCRIKGLAAQLLNNPNAARTVLILSVLAIAAITGAAPNDMH